MQRFEKILTSFAEKSNGIAAASVVLIMMMIVVDVILRQFRIPLPGTYDLVGLLGSVVISFSLGYTSIQKGHIAVEFLYDKMPERFRHAMSAFTELVGLLFFLILSWQCVVYAFQIKISGEVSPTIKAPNLSLCLGNCPGMSSSFLYSLLSVLSGKREERCVR